MMTPETHTSDGLSDPPLPARSADLPTLPSPGPAPDIPAKESRLRAFGRRAWVPATQLGLLVVVLGGWQLAVDGKHVNVFFYGSPGGTWKELYSWMRHGTLQGSLWQQAWVTMQETLIGFGIGVLFGVTMGMLLGRINWLARVFTVYIGTFNAIPRIVLGSVFVIWFGLGMASKVALAILLVFFSVFFNTFQGAREVDRNLIAHAHVLGAGRAAVFRHVVLPSTLSWIIASLRVAFGLAITGSVVGELIGSTQGLGLLIEQSQGNFDPDGVYAGLIVTTVLAVTAEALINVLERRFLRWKPRRRALTAEV